MEWTGLSQFTNGLELKNGGLSEYYSAKIPEEMEKCGSASDQAYTSAAKTQLYGIYYTYCDPNKIEEGDDIDYSVDGDDSDDSEDSDSSRSGLPVFRLDPHEDINDNYGKMNIDTDYSNEVLRISVKAVGLFTSESFLRSIENGYANDVTEFLKSSWEVCERRLEALCVQSIDRVGLFHLNIDDDLMFGNRAIQLAARKKNAKAFSLITSALFFRAIKNGDEKGVSKFLNSFNSGHALSLKSWHAHPIDRKFRHNLIAFDMDCILGSCISFFDWLEGLCIAKNDKKFNIYNLLFKYEKLINAKTKNGWNALHLAMLHSQRQFGRRERERIELLLKSGRFDVNDLTDELETVLHLACRCQTPNKRNGAQLEELIQELLRHKLNVNQRNVSGQTALMIACDNGNPAAVRALIGWKDARGVKVDINVKDKSGQNALSIAKKMNIAEILSMIERAFILAAVESGEAKAIEIYLNTYIEEDEIQVKRTSAVDDLRCDRALNLSSSKMICNFNHSIWLDAVYLAHKNSQNDILELILNNGGFISGFNEDGQTALHVLVKDTLDYCNFELRELYGLDYIFHFTTMKEKNEYFDENNCKELQMIKVLLNSLKCDINVSNATNETVLHYLCQTRRPNSRLSLEFKTRIESLLMRFLQNGIDVNRRTNQGKTALMLACENGLTQVVRSLFSLSRPFGIYLDIDAVDNSGETAMMKAIRNDHLKTAQDLMRLEFLTAVEDANEGSVKRMLDMDEKDFYGSMKTWSTVSKENEACKKQSTECRINFRSWLHAMFIAIDKSSENILKLLLDYDFIVKSQQYVDDKEILPILLPLVYAIEHKKYQLIKRLLESRKVNLNEINSTSETVLHHIARHKSDSDEITKPIGFFLHHGANINQKNADGETPLMIATKKHNALFIETIVNWAEMTGTWLDVDARDCNGETALMMAAQKNHHDIVQMLLYSEASVNISDNHGFTALHHALFEKKDILLNMNKKKWIYFDDFPTNYHEMKKIQYIITNSCDSNPESEMNKKTVKLLLTHETLDLNALNCVRYSPLDIAEASIPKTPNSIKWCLKNKGIKLNIFCKRETPLTTDPSFGMTYLLFVLFREENSLNFKWNLSMLSENIKRELIPNKDHKERTLLHHVSISAFDKFFNLVSNNAGNKYNVVEFLISLGCSVNAVDIYGRTPLHYANDKTLQRVLLSNGADETIKDKDGISAIEMANTPIEGGEKYSSECDKDITCGAFKRIHGPILLRQNYMKMEIEILGSNDKGPVQSSGRLNRKTIPELLWEDGCYAFRHPAVEQIKRDVSDLMKAIALEIERRDPRFLIKPELVGSSYEGTKLDSPNEFDFCFVLKRFSELCEISLSPELPTGFLHLKRGQMHKMKSEFDCFFSESQMLITEKLAIQFKKKLKHALLNVLSQKKCDWDLDMDSGVFAFILPKTRLATTLTLKKMMCDPGNKRIIRIISIDITPCIHIDGWWPNEAIGNVDDEIKAEGCFLVFDRPQRYYPWIPYSESCVMISFAKAECETIKKSPFLAKQVFMIAKKMNRRQRWPDNDRANVNDDNKSDAKNEMSSFMDKHISAMVDKLVQTKEYKYIMKNCLLYCIEALTPMFENVSGHRPQSDESNFFKNIGIESYIWLESLMKCHLNFVAQDFCPCYFMPTFSLPIDDSLEGSYMNWILNNKNFYPARCIKAHELLLDVTKDDPEIRLELPSPDLTCFNREKLVSDISEAAFKKLEKHQKR